MSGGVYVCPWWCTATDHPRTGRFIADEYGNPNAEPLHAREFTGPARVAVIALASAPEPCVSVAALETTSASELRTMAACLIAAADLLDQCAGDLPL